MNSLSNKPDATINKRHFRRYMSIVALILFIFAVWSTNLAGPLIGMHDDVVGQVVLSSDSYERYGFAKMGLLYVFDADPIQEDPIFFYVSGPGLSGLLTALLTQFWGDVILSTRLMAAFLTLLGAVAFYQFIRQAWDDRRAFFALAIYLLVPVVAYYGHNPIPDMLAVSGFSFILLAYQRHTYKATRFTLIALIAAVLFSSLISLYDFFIIPALCLHALIYNRNRWQLIFILCIPILIGKAIWLVPGITLEPNLPDRLMERFTTRSFVNTSPPWDNLWDYISQTIFVRFRTVYTEAICVLVIFGIISVFKNRILPIASSRHFLFTMIILIGIAPVIIFPEAYFWHNFMSLLLVPGLAITATTGLMYINSEILTNRRIRHSLRFGIVLLLIATFSVSWFRWTVTFYNVDSLQTPNIGKLLNERVPPGNIIYNNMGFSSTTWYYAQRNFATLGAIEPGQESEVYRFIYTPSEVNSLRANQIFRGEKVCELFVPDSSEQ